MSTRDALEGRLVLFGLSQQAAKRAVDAFAHELAEKIRSDIGPVKDTSDNFDHGAAYAADLIDPEVSE